MASFAERVFDSIDANGNGTIQKFELLEFCREHSINVAKFTTQLGQYRHHCHDHTCTIQSTTAVGATRRPCLPPAVSA